MKAPGRALRHSRQHPSASTPPADPVAGTWPPHAKGGLLVNAIDPIV